MSTKQQARVIAQLAPTAGAETTLFSVPAQTEIEIDALYICNRGTVQDTVRVAISVGGGAVQNKDYLYYDLPIDPNDTFVANTGLKMVANDIMRVRSALGTTSFNLIGPYAFPVQS